MAQKSLGDSPVEVFAPLLIQGGYQVRPVKPGFKHPASFKGWQQPDTDGTFSYEALVQYDLEDNVHHGIGILLRNCMAVDIDVESTHADMQEHLIDIVVKHFGKPSFRRYSASGRFMVFYRMQAPDNKKLQSAKYVTPEVAANYLLPGGSDNDIDTLQVEFLTGNNFAMLFGENPTHGVDYEWDSEDKYGLCNTPLDELTLVKPETVELVQYLIDELFEAHGYVDKKTLDKQAKVQQRDTARSGGGLAKPSATIHRIHIGKERVVDPEILETFQHIRSRGVYDSEQVCSMLEYIPAHTDEKEWRDVMMAMHYLSGGSQEAYGDLLTWSQTSTKAGHGDDRDISSRWRSCNSDAPNPIGIGTLVTIAKSYGWTDPRFALSEAKRAERFHARTEMPRTVEDMLERFVLVERDLQVVDLRAFANEQPRRFWDFLQSCANLPKIDVSNTDKPKMENIARLWQAHPDRRTVQDFRYAPGRSRVFECALSNQTLCNTFTYPKYWREPNPASADLRVFLQYCDYLFPVKQEREYVLNWFAYHIRNPQVRLPVAILHICPFQGSGRGRFQRLMSALVGEQNVSVPGLKEVLGIGTNFNEWHSEKLFAFVEEAKIKKSDETGQMDHLNTVITEDRALINHKYGGKRMESVFTALFIQSNHYDAIPLERGSRRFTAVRGADAPHPEGDGMYSAISAIADDPEALSDIWHFFRERDISEFDAFKPLKTETFHRMVASTATDTETVFHAMMDSCWKDRAVFPLNLAYAEMLNWVRENMDDDFTVVTKAGLKKQFDRALRRQDGAEGAGRFKVEIDGEKYRSLVWTPYKESAVDKSKITRRMRKLYVEKLEDGFDQGDL